MRYIRRIDNPLKILRSGYVASGGLGAFDEAVYEEVEGDLPEGWEPEVILSLEDRVKAAFSALDISLQIKFAAEIMQAAFFFERENLPMVAVVMAGAEQRLILPEDQPVKDIIDAAKAELGG